MGVTSTRAAREADVVAGQISQLERVAERRRAIGRLRKDVADRVAALEQQMAEDPNSASNRLSEELIGLGRHIQTATGELDQALEPVRSLASTNMKLRRTLYRGVYASGDRYVVPYFDGLGIEQRPKFETLGEARRLAWVRRREERQREFADGHLPSGYDRPTHSSGSNP